MTFIMIYFIAGIIYTALTWLVAEPEAITAMKYDIEKDRRNLGMNVGFKTVVVVLVVLMVTLWPFFFFRAVSRNG